MTRPPNLPDPAATDRLILALAQRVYEQSELLSRAAERARSLPEVTMNTVKPSPTVGLQELNDAGLNPFAVQLLTESWRRHPKGRLPVRFVFDGVEVCIREPDPVTGVVDEKKMIEGLRDELARITRDRDQWRERSNLHDQMTPREYWIWQGDDSDYPESLSCPVLIGIADLRALLARPRAAEADRDRLRDACEHALPAMETAAREGGGTGYYQEKAARIREALVPLPSVPPKKPTCDEIPRCMEHDGSTLRIVPAYTEAGINAEANCVTITDGERTVVYVPYAVARPKAGAT